MIILDSQEYGDIRGHDKDLQKALYDDWNRCKLTMLKMEWEEIPRGRPRKNFD